MSSSNKILERLTKLHPKIIDLSLDRVISLLAKLKNPHEQIPPVIHIAGTNGKGSTLSFIQNIHNMYILHTYGYTYIHTNIVALVVQTWRPRQCAQVHE